MKSASAVILYWLPMFFSIMALSACDGSGGGSNIPKIETSDNCSNTAQNQSLLNYLEEHYYWYRDIPANLNLANYSTPYDVLDAIRVPQDIYSFIMTEQQYTDTYTNANAVAYGFSQVLAPDKQSLLVRFVYDNGSADTQGLTRGDRIIAIDGVAVSSLVSQVEAGSTSWSEIFGPSTVGYSGNFIWIKPDGEQVETNMVKSVVDTNTLLHHEVINYQDQKVGYMVFNRFIDRSIDDLNMAFNTFANDDVEQLILDLRYNGGGLVSVANQLASQIAGNNVLGKTFSNLKYNDKNSQNNVSYQFDLGGGAQQLDLENVIVLTTEATCSASELVVNALMPYIDVVTIGNATCGKPIGMNPVQICDKVIFAINFETTNGEDQGGYFDGLPVTCSVQDNIVGDWGSLQDPLLKQGLDYLDTQQCNSSQAQQSVTKAINWDWGPDAHLNLM